MTLTPDAVYLGPLANAFRITLRGAGMAEAHREEIAKLEALYASNPEGRVFTHLAEVYRKSGDLEKARQILANGIRRHPDSASAFVVLGRVLSDSGDGPAGFDAFKRALDLDTGNLVALRWCGDLAMRAGRVDDALGFYHELIARDPSDADLRERVAVIEIDRDAAMSVPPNAAADAAAAVETPEYPSAMVPHPSAELHFEPTDLSGDATQPAGGEEYDPSDLPGDLAAFAGQQIESRTGKSWDPQTSDEDAARQAEDDLMFAPLVDEADDSAPDDGFEAFALDGLEPGSGMEPAESSLDSFSTFDLAGDEPVDVFEASDELVGFEAPRDDMAETNPVIQPDDSVYGTNPSEVDASEFDLSDAAIAAEPAYDAEPAYEPEATIEAEAPFEPAVAWAPEPDALSEPDAAPEPQATPEPTEVAEAAFESEAAWTAEPSKSTAPPSIGGSGLVTETMAELYRNQGFPDRAADVYRQLIRERGGDARVEKMLAELEGSGANAGPQDDLVLDQDAAGEMWLKDEVSPWTSAEPGGAEHSSPSAWAHPADEPDAGPPIGSYFASLLQWRPGTATADPSDQETDGTDEVFDDVLLLDEADEDPGPELPMLHTEPQSAPAELMPWESAEPVAESPQDESPQDEAPPMSFEAPAPVPFEAPALPVSAAPPAVHHDPMPWDAPAETADSAAPSSASDVPAPAPSAASPAPVAASSASTEELMPWETAPPEDPAHAPVSAAAPLQAAPAMDASQDAAPSSGDANGEGDAEGEDDEDLEMFRSWLQSLKK